MKALFVVALSLLSFTASAQALNSFNGDYKLSFSVSACNPTARVEISPAQINIINQDLKDNRGWSTLNLAVGEKTSTQTNGTSRVTKVSVQDTRVVRETSIREGRREIGYKKDEFEFTDKNGKKGLMIRLEIETRGNVSGYGTTCGYEKL